jgi:hypothetical protein
VRKKRLRNRKGKSTFLRNLIIFGSGPAFGLCKTVKASRELEKTKAQQR